MDREALALIFGVRQFHKYLVGLSFTLVTCTYADHRPQVKDLGPNEGVLTLAAARLSRWAQILSAYTYHQPRVANAEADMLSRLWKSLLPKTNCTGSAIANT